MNNCRLILMSVCCKLLSGSEMTCNVFVWGVKLYSLTPGDGLYQGRTGSPGSLTFARWAGWSAGQVGRYVKY